MGSIAAVVLGGAVLYAAFALLLYVFQQRLVFFPTTGAYPVTPDSSTCHGVMSAS
jgi:hypothetical protein